MHQSRLNVRNDSDRPMRIIFEPWGLERSIDQSSDMTIEMRSELDGWPEITAGTDTLTVAGWAGSMLRVWHHGHAVLDIPIPVPQIGIR